MNKQQLFENIKKKQSFLCVGLDTDIKEGDRAEVTLRDGCMVSLQVGEVHPYSFQYQCRVERKARA